MYIVCRSAVETRLEEKEHATMTRVRERGSTTSHSRARPPATRDMAQKEEQ